MTWFEFGGHRFICEENVVVYRVPCFRDGCFFYSSVIFFLAGKFFFFFFVFFLFIHKRESETDQKLMDRVFIPLSATEDGNKERGDYSY